MYCVNISVKNMQKIFRKKKLFIFLYFFLSAKKKQIFFLQKFRKNLILKANKKFTTITKFLCKKKKTT